MDHRKQVRVWLLAIIGGWFLVLSPGNIEGLIFPVVSDVEISAVPDPQDPTYLLVSGSVHKDRSCNPRYIEWYVGERGGANVSTPAIWGPPVINIYNETFQFYNWRVQAAPPEVLMNNTFSDVLHQCYLRIPYSGINISFPWLTRSAFWR